MPIGGFVVTVVPQEVEGAEERLAAVEGVEVHGRDGKGNLVVVIEADSSDQMNEIVKNLQRMDEVLSVGLVYLNAEDEVERLDAGASTDGLVHWGRGDDGE